MRNRLLATVAVAAVVGFGGFAAAQSQTDCPVPPGTTSGTIQLKSGAALRYRDQRVTRQKSHGISFRGLLLSL